MTKTNATDTFAAFWAGSAGQQFCNAVEAGNARVIYANAETEERARASDALLPRWD